MIKSRIIVTGATGKTGSVVVAELLKAGYPVRTMVRREDGRSAQLKRERALMKLFKIAALFLLSISTRASVCGRDQALQSGRIRTSLRPRASRYCSISAQTGAPLRSASACDPGVDGAKQVQRPDDVHH